MENFMRSRVRTRLDALGLNPFQAAKMAEVNRYLIFDLLEGKKETIRQKALVKVAAALQCDPEYLIGAQPAPHRRNSAEGPERQIDSVPLAGICEAGAWRSPDATKTPQALPIQPDTRFPANDQRAFIARGDTAEGIGIHDGDILVTVPSGPPRDGDTVIVRRVKPSAEVEISARRVKGSLLIAGSPSIPNILATDAEIVGRIIAAHRVF